MRRLRLAIVGCGAAAKYLHVPVAVSSGKVDVMMLVDKCLPRARTLADAYNVPAVTDDYRGILGKVDAALVVLPHHLHAPVTVDLLQYGIHVLVEKPMALTTSDCDQMNRLAREAGVVLAVGLVRRFYASSQFVKAALEKELLGEIISVDVQEGHVYGWDVASDFMFRRDAGGGVLADTGAHVLDLLLWWLGGWDRVEYYDDAMGGVEANCRLHVKLERGVTGAVELSRTRNLRNTVIIEGERGVLELGTDLNPFTRLRINGEDLALGGQVWRDDVAKEPMLELFDRQLDDFVGAVNSGREPFIPGREGKRAVELIETCYASRQPLEVPWGCFEQPGKSERE